MNLVIDIGNSSVKIGCFEAGKISNPVRITTVESLEQEVKKLNPSNIIDSSMATFPGNIIMHSQCIIQPWFYRIKPHCRLLLIIKPLKPWGLTGLPR